MRLESRWSKCFYAYLAGCKYSLHITLHITVVLHWNAEI